MSPATTRHSSTIYWVVSLPPLCRIAAVFDVTSLLLVSQSRPQAQDDETKKRLRTEFLKNEFPRYFGGVEKLIAGPFVLGDKPSIADVAIYTSLQSFTDGSLDHIPADSVNAYPKMVAVAAHVKAMPAVQARLQAQAK